MYIFYNFGIFIMDVSFYYGYIISQMCFLIRFMMLVMKSENHLQPSCWNQLKIFWKIPCPFSNGIAIILRFWGQQKNYIWIQGVVKYLLLDRYVRTFSAILSWMNRTNITFSLHGKGLTFHFVTLHHFYM